MKNLAAKYNAMLTGDESIEFYLDKLRSNSKYKVTSTERENKIRVHIVGPHKTSENESINDIHDKLLHHAKELGIKAPKLVKDVETDIYNAQKAEKAVLDGEMLLEAIPNVKAHSVYVTLHVILCCYNKFNEIIDQFAFFRISELANSIGMGLVSIERKNMHIH